MKFLPTRVPDGVFHFFGRPSPPPPGRRGAQLLANPHARSPGWVDFQHTADAAQYPDCAGGAAHITRIESATLATSPSNVEPLHAMGPS